jgi:hypothetical protein
VAKVHGATYEGSDWQLIVEEPMMTGQSMHGTWLLGAKLLPLLCGLAFFSADARDAKPAQASAATPKSADGHPDLTGFWVDAKGGFPGFPLPPNGGDPAVFKVPLRNGDISNLTNDNVLARRANDNLPAYKPEYWDKVVELDHNGNKLDPFIHCLPIAPPRLGPPAQIIQMQYQVLFFYRVPFERNDFRIIPIGPRTHPLDPDGTWTGDPVAHWDGDTLVVVTEGFNDQSWIDSEGYLHGYNLKTIESFKRVGDTLTYNVTVEDPDYLQKPWVLDTQTLIPIRKPDFRLEDSPPCSDRDSEHQVGTQREL